MVGEAEDGAVAARQPPGMADGRRLAGEMGGEARRQVSQGSISTSGMAGMRPALKAVRSTSMRSTSKRTGTSNSKPAVMAAPSAGTAPAAKVTRPVAGSTATSGGGHGAAVDGDEHGAVDRLGDGALAGAAGIGVGLDELEGRRRAVAGADPLVRRSRRRVRSAGPEVDRIAEAEAVELAASAPRRTTARRRGRQRPRMPEPAS